MHNLVILFVHLLTTVAQLASPGGVRSVVAESVPVKRRSELTFSNLLFMNSGQLPRVG